MQTDAEYGIMHTVMENFWNDFAESDPTRRPAPDWYFWPGIILIAICALVAVANLLSF